MSILATIPDPTGLVEVNYQDDPEKVWFTSKAAIDSDGSGSSHGDPDQEQDTSLHTNGKPLNADVDRYIVVPPSVIQGTKGIVLGCRAVVTNQLTGIQVDCVVGDIGPHHKIGEISIATAIALVINPSPTTGGIDDHVILYEIYPGQQADGYQLQASV